MPCGFFWTYRSNYAQFKRCRAAGPGDPGVSRQGFLTGSTGMETVTMIGFGLVLVVWLYGLTALLMRRPRHG